MSTPVLILGGRSGLTDASHFALWASSGHEYQADDSSPVQMRGETDAVAPAGVGGECTFDKVTLTFTHSMAVTLRITPILDGEPLTSEARNVTLPAWPARKSTAIEFVLSRGFMENGVEVLRYALRGCWFAVRIDSGPLGAGDLLIEPGTLEYTVVTESRSSI